MADSNTDTDDDVYPDVPADAEGGDALVRLLSEMDEDHHTKAVMLIGAARTEWAHAVDQGEISDSFDFAEFAEMGNDAWAKALEE